VSLLRSKGLLCIDLPVFLLLPEELVLREHSSHHEALHVCPLEFVALLIHKDQPLLLSLLEAHLQWVQERPAEHSPPLALIHQYIEALQAVPNLPQCPSYHSARYPDTAAHPVTQILPTLHVVLPSSLLFHIIIVPIM
jgi:hypothetical protein